MFNSNVQPKRRIKERATAWHCNCRKLLGPYQLNFAELTRGAVCGVARINGLGPRDDDDDRVPMIRKAGDADAGVPQDVSRFRRGGTRSWPQAPVTPAPFNESREDEGCRDSCPRYRSLMVVRLVPIASGS